MIELVEERCSKLGLGDGNDAAVMGGIDRPIHGAGQTNFRGFAGLRNHPSTCLDGDSELRRQSAQQFSDIPCGADRNILDRAALGPGEGMAASVLDRQRRLATGTGREQPNDGRA